MEYAEGEWVENPSGELVWQPAEGGDAISAAEAGYASPDLGAAIGDKPTSEPSTTDTNGDAKSDEATASEPAAPEAEATSAEPDATPDASGVDETAPPTTERPAEVAAASTEETAT